MVNVKEKGSSEMKKILSTILIGIMMCTLMVSCGSDSQTSGESLVLYTWEGMFAQDVLDEFEEETGIEIEYAIMDANETMLARLQENDASEYDIIVADDYILDAVISEDLAMELDKSQISNYDNINPFYQSQFYDPDNKYTIPFGAGIPLIVYDQDAVGFEITSYEDLWDERLEDNVALIGNYRVINGITLLSMGHSMNESDLTVLEEAGEKLQDLAPNVRAISDNNTQDFLLSGEVSAAFLYTSQVLLALESNENLSLCYPEEGVGFGISNLFVPKNAPNAESAYAFIEFINRPEIAARLFENVRYYTTNKASEEYISEEMKEKLILPEDIQSGEIIQTIPQDADDLQLSNWNEFRQATGQ